MQKNYDLVIIGGGLLGCFVARNLSRYNWKIAVLEKNGDVCTEVSKANTAIIYPGYDPKPGSLKARLSVDANNNFAKLCKSLGVRNKQTGSLMVSFGEKGESAINKKLDQGKQNGLNNLRILNAQETIALEPRINKNVTGALFSPLTSTVNPWEVGIAGAVNAANNGVDYYFNCKVDGITSTSSGQICNIKNNSEPTYSIICGKNSFTARAVINCAGILGDKVNEMINKPRFKIVPSIADFLLLDQIAEGHVNHIIMYEPEEKGRKLSIVPTIEGNILLGPSRIKTDTIESFGTTKEGCNLISEVAKYVFPSLPINSVIRSFASIRPKISIVEADEEGNYITTEEKIHDLLIYESENPGFINLAGIRTPGLTCCDEIGKYVSEMLLDILGNPGENSDFSPIIQEPVRFDEQSAEKQSELIKMNKEYGRIVCRCRHITEAEIRDSIRMPLGATTLDGVKRRVGAQMGRCQGGFCTQKIIEILAEELGINISEVQKDGFGSELINSGK